jgi:hypothetical protein
MKTLVKGNAEFNHEKRRRLNHVLLTGLVFISLHILLLLLIYAIVPRALSSEFPRVAELDPISLGQLGLIILWSYYSFKAPIVLSVIALTLAIPHRRYYNPILGIAGAIWLLFDVLLYLNDGKLEYPIIQDVYILAYAVTMFNYLVVAGVDVVSFAVVWIMIHDFRGAWRSRTK